ncbi:hypothetical protein ACFL59_10295 [Planctomycetota bacterium]
MSRPTVLLLAALLLLAGSMRAEAKYRAYPLHERIGLAELIIRGTIERVYDKTFILKVDAVYKGSAERGEAILVEQFEDWTCARRGDKYDAGQEMICFLRRKKGEAAQPFRSLGAGCEGEARIEGGTVYVRFGPTGTVEKVKTRSGTVRGHAWPLTETEEALRFLSERLQVVEEMSSSDQDVLYAGNERDLDSLSESAAALVRATIEKVPMMRNESKHLERSTPVVTAWRGLSLGAPVHAVTDLLREKDWLDDALVQQIPFQTGHWRVNIENGHTVFRIYPHLAKDEKPKLFQGIVVKVDKPDVSVEELKATITSRDGSLHIVEYRVFGDGIEVYRPREQR